MNKHLIGSKFARFIFALSVISLGMLMDFFFLLFLLSCSNQMTEKDEHQNNWSLGSIFQPRRKD